MKAASLPVQRTTPMISSTSHIQAAKYQRQIIMNADGSYTDAPMGSYATANATAAAKIYLSE